jgi:hypothetical protein
MSKVGHRPDVTIQAISNNLKDLTYTFQQQMLNVGDYWHKGINYID